MEVTRVGAALGAEITGVDLSGQLDDVTLKEIRDALVEHQVLVLHAPELTPDQHMALGRAMGEIEVHAFFPNLGDGYEQVSVLDSETGNTASRWHTDETFLEHPPMGTLTWAKVLPPVGGDTLFASTTAAYAALSPNMKRYLEGVGAVHDLAAIAELRVRFGSGTPADLARAVAEERRTVHPVVRVHPETGRPGLFVNPTYTSYLVGLPPEEADLVLAHLYRHATKEVFTYRHRWRVGDLVMWDNRSTMHMVMADFTGRRVMHRVSVVGSPEA